MNRTSEYEHHLRSLARRLELETSGYGGGSALNSALEQVKAHYNLTGTPQEIYQAFKKLIPTLVLEKENESAK